MLQYREGILAMVCGTVPARRLLVGCPLHLGKSLCCGNEEAEEIYSGCGRFAEILSQRGSRDRGFSCPGHPVRTLISVSPLS